MTDALKLAEQSQDPIAKACALRGLGEIESAKDNQQQAIDFFQQSKIRFQSVGDEKGVEELNALMRKLEE